MAKKSQEKADVFAPPPGGEGLFENLLEAWVRNGDIANGVQAMVNTLLRICRDTDGMNEISTGIDTHMDGFIKSIQHAADAKRQKAEAEKAEHARQLMKAAVAQAAKEQGIKTLDASGIRLLEPESAAVGTDGITRRILPFITDQNIEAGHSLTCWHGGTPYDVVCVFGLTGDNIKLDAPLDYTDARLIWAVATLWLRGHRIVTARQLYRQLAYGNANASRQVQPEELETLDSRIKRLRCINCRIDFTEEIAALKLDSPKNKTWTDPYTGAKSEYDKSQGITEENIVLNVRGWPVKGRNGNVERGYFLDFSPIARYAFDTGKYIKIPAEVMEAGAGSPLSQDLLFALLGEVRRIAADTANVTPCRDEEGRAWTVSTGKVRLLPYKDAEDGKECEKGGLLAAIGHKAGYDMTKTGKYTSNALRAQRNAVEILKRITDALRASGIIEDASFQPSSKVMVITVRTSKAGDKTIEGRLEAVEKNNRRVLSTVRKTRKEVRKIAGNAESQKQKTK